MTNSTLLKPRFVWLLLVSILILFTALAMSATGYTQDTSDVITTTTSITPHRPSAYPPDPTSDIDWNAGLSGVADIQNAFNHARSVEYSQLGTIIPAMTLPSQSEWDSKSDGEKALWLINRDRIDRGLLPLHGVETNVTGVAQYYADYLFDNNTWGHSEDGNSPWERLNTNAAINACHDFLSVSENLAVFAASGNNIPLPIERSVYMWMYDDANSGWGHRHAILWTPYNDNSGEMGKEGFLGIGRANGGPYQGPFSNPWNFAELIVMNVFDPCPSWVYAAEPPMVTSITPAQGENTGSINITNLAGSNFSTTGVTTVELRKSGESPIVATNVSVVSESKITCDFDLTGAAVGSWDVVVTNPDSQVSILSGGFTVNSPPVPAITSITPAHGENIGSVAITNLAGNNFSTTGVTAVSLQKSGESPIVATNVSVVSESKITCDFDLTGAATGSWDVVVTNPDNEIATLAGGFWVTNVLDEFIYLPLITDQN